MVKLKWRWLDLKNNEKQLINCPKQSPTTSKLSKTITNNLTRPVLLEPHQKLKLQQLSKLVALTLRKSSKNGKILKSYKINAITYLHNSIAMYKSFEGLQSSKCSNLRSGIESQIERNIWKLSLKSEPNTKIIPSQNMTPQECNNKKKFYRSCMISCSNTI